MNKKAIDYIDTLNEHDKKVALKAISLIFIDILSNAIEENDTVESL